MKKDLVHTLKIIAFVAVLLGGAGFAQSHVTPRYEPRPAVTPPGSNIPAPIRANYPYQQRIEAATGGDGSAGTLWAVGIGSTNGYCIGTNCITSWLDKSPASGRGTFEWKVGTVWSECTQTCGGGTKTAKSWCERSDGAVFAASNCTGTPNDTEACNTQACPGGYDPSECNGSVYNERTGTWFHCE